MALPRRAHLELLVPIGLAALMACGSAGDSTTPATCAGCEGALCHGGCTDLSAALAADVTSRLPASACIPPTSVQGGASVCTAQICPACTGEICPAGGTAGCTMSLSFGPVALGKDTHLVKGTVTASAPVDAHLSGTDCVATVTATLSYRAGATFACTPGAETATFGTFTTTVDGSSVDPGTCGLLAVYLDQFRVATFEAAAEAAVRDALAQATASVTATCP